jgi:hypothetical protein
VSAATQVSIVNRALLKIGQNTLVSSISPPDNTQAASVAAQLFGPTFEALARQAHWNCLRNQVTLSLIMAAQGTPENPTGNSLTLPPQPWLYGYELPSDCLMVRSLLPFYPTINTGTPQTTFNNAAPSCPPNGWQIPFQVAFYSDSGGNPGQVILTNLEFAQAIYTTSVSNPSIWDSQFQEAMVASLAAEFVPALNLNMALMQTQLRIAESVIMAARVSDGNEGVHCQDHTPDWITTRGGASWRDYSGQYGNCQGAPWGGWGG